MSDENNRATAKRLTKSIAFCKCEQCQQTVEDKIFTELQIAQKRGEYIAKMRWGQIGDDANPIANSDGSKTFTCVECGENFDVSQCRLRFMRPPICCSATCAGKALDNQGRQRA